MTKMIPLSQGKVTLVDDRDFEWLSQWSWHVQNHMHICYARRTLRKNGKKRAILMHQLIIGISSELETDHINRDGLDNRRSNLRHCTHAENNRNQRKFASCSSRYKGVHWDNERQTWRARITAHGRSHHLGRFTDEQEAARAYNQAALEYFGEFAYLNIIG